MLACVCVCLFVCVCVYESIQCSKVKEIVYIGNYSAVIKLQISKIVFLGCGADKIKAFLLVYEWKRMKRKRKKSLMISIKRVA